MRTLLLILLISVYLPVFGQQLVWYKVYSFTSSSGLPLSMVVTKSGKVYSSHKSLPYLVDNQGNVTQSNYLNRFIANGDLLSFGPNNPGTLVSVGAFRVLPNKSIIMSGANYKVPYSFNPFTIFSFVSLMDSNAIQTKREYLFQDPQITRTLGQFGDFLPNPNSSYWATGVREDSLLTQKYSPYLMLFDSTGNFVSERDFLDSGSSYVRTMLRLSNKNLLVFGDRNIIFRQGTQNVIKLKFFALELDSVGNFIRRRYFNLNNQPGQSFPMDQNYNPAIYGALHPDGGYIMYGNLLNRNWQNDSTGFIMKIDTAFTQTQWIRRMKPVFKLRVLADGSSFISGFVSSRTLSYLFLRRYDASGRLFQDVRINAPLGTLPNGIVYTLLVGNYEFAGDSSVIFIGDVVDVATMYNPQPYLFIAKKGGYPNPYNPLALPVDQPMVREPYVYPNPFQDQFTISTEVPEVGQLYLFNTTGQLMHQTSYTTGSLLSVGNLPLGVYLWRFVGRSRHTGRLVRE